jgi:hypothetical protein
LPPEPAHLIGGLSFGEGPTSAAIRPVAVNAASAEGREIEVRQ